MKISHCQFPPTESAHVLAIQAIIDTLIYFMYIYKYNNL